MHKEPLGLYIFRFVVGLGVLIFMVMLYWSSDLIEERTLQLHDKLASLENAIFETRLEVQKNRGEILKVLIEENREQRELLENVIQNRENITDIEKYLSQKGSITTFHSDEKPVVVAKKEQESSREQIDPSLPNLLEEDVFYEKTLPDMLGKNFHPYGTRHITEMGMPHNLHPFSNWATAANLVRMCGIAVATNLFGKYETMAPNAAIKMEARNIPGTDIPEFWVHLHDDLYWQPLEQKHFPKDVKLSPHFFRKHQVTAHDFKFYFDALMNPHLQEGGASALRQYLGDISSFTVIDDQTFVVRWKTEKVDGVDKIKYSAKMLTGWLRPLPRFVYQYFPNGQKIVEDDSDLDTYRNNSVWAQNFSQHWAKNIIVGCGSWLFDGITEKNVKMRRNNDFYDPYANLINNLEITFKDTPESIWQDFKAGKTDTYELRPDQLIDLENFLQSEEYQNQAKQKKSIKRLDYLDRAYAYIGWNQANPLFRNKKVRQALTMAIDRNRIIQQNLNKMGIQITGTFFRNSPSYDSTVDYWPYDPHESSRLLEEEGWYDSDGDGVRNKIIDGKKIPFVFNLTYYVKSPTGKATCEYISSALKKIGVICKLNGVDVADLDSVFAEKNFDAALLAWSLGSPPENPKQLWHSSGAKEKGSSNLVGFANDEADDIIAALEYEYDYDKRLKLYHRFHRILHEEQPYTFLYTPKRVLLYREHLENVFIPAERQDLVPGANIAEPDLSVTWIRKPT